jgi:hypothetical protein
MFVSKCDRYADTTDRIPLRAVQDGVAWCYDLLLANRAVLGVSRGLAMLIIDRKLTKSSGS